jgi:6-phosphofructokinase
VSIRRVAIVFSGGPAPAANAVISAAAMAFLRDGIEVLGLIHGYEGLMSGEPLVEDVHYHRFKKSDLRGLRNQRGVIVGTSRLNPAVRIQTITDLDDEEKCAPLATTHRALVDLGVDALISIGGDGTLRTANLFALYQRTLPAGLPRLPVVHLPKTIDNDYRGIDFTFGFFTAVDLMAKEALNLHADAKATRSWFVVETMGRKAGWLSYGVAVAGEANLVVALEDLDEDLLTDGYLDIDKLSDRIVDLMLRRETQDRKEYGVVVLAEGLANLLPPSTLDGVPRDPSGHVSLSRLNLAELVAERSAERYRQRAKRSRKLKAVQLGYEARSAPPHAFDVMLGSQLGVGAYRAIVEERLQAHMVSVTGQFDLRYVPFAQLCDPLTGQAEMRFIEPGSDFHRLVRFLETTLDSGPTWRRG